ncbi:hypothetical protein FOL47_003748, partial [Perkinsus chesapeaki]
VKRGSYKKIRSSARARVAQAFRDGEDGYAIAAANGIKPTTAATYAKRCKMTRECVESAVAYVEQNPQATLKMMADEIHRQHGISVSQQTVKNHLDSLAYTVKRPHMEGEAVNNPQNRHKRKEYVQTVSVIPSEDLVFFDETNVNLFIKRGVARSVRGSRAVVKEGS